MARPSEKAPEIVDLLEKTFGRTTAIESDTCVACDGEAKVFTDALSQREYEISGLCQNCQNVFFGEDE